MSKNLCLLLACTFTTHVYCLQPVTPRTPKLAARLSMTRPNFAAAPVSILTVVAAQPAFALDDIVVQTPHAEWKKILFLAVALLSVSHSLLPNAFAKPFAATKTKKPRRSGTPTMALGAATKAAQIQVCTGPSCSRSGSRLLLEISRALTTVLDEQAVEIQSTGCLRPCRGIVTRRPSRALSILDACSGMSSEAARARLDMAVQMLVAEGVDEDALKQAQIGLLAKIAGDDALEQSDLESAVNAYSEAIESAAARVVFGSMASSAASAAAVPTPKFGLKKPSSGSTPSAWAPYASAAEAERVLPGSKRWLYEALTGRAGAALERSTREAESAYLASACADAERATMLCGLASAGWYQLRDAAAARGDDAQAEAAVDELRRLGYSLEPGEEGERASAAKGAKEERYDPWGRLIA